MQEDCQSVLNLDDRERWKKTELAKVEGLTKLTKNGTRRMSEEAKLDTIDSLIRVYEFRI
jgi:hypothetical protein